MAGGSCTRRANDKAEVSVLGKACLSKSFVHLQKWASLRSNSNLSCWAVSDCFHHERIGLLPKTWASADVTNRPKDRYVEHR